MIDRTRKIPRRMSAKERQRMRTLLGECLILRNKTKEITITLNKMREIATGVIQIEMLIITTFWRRMTSATRDIVIVARITTG